MSLQPGQMLSQYRLVERAGEGGMGVVWRAVDTRLDRDVALKILAPEVAGNPELLERFRREAKAIAALNHPNIVTIHEVDEHDGIPFIAMELLSGLPLSQSIPEQGLPLELFFDLAVPIADALQTAHARGITHRDLKPANIMVSPEGRPKILDFGLAKLKHPEGEGRPVVSMADTITRQGRILGTMPYMSPEQARGDEIDHRSDIFSLGIIYYEMATGRRPFRGETAADLVSSILRDSPQPATGVSPRLPRRLDGILTRCLEKDPARRFQTASDLRSELAGAHIEVSSGTARLGPPHGPVRSWRAAALLGILAGALVVLYFVRPRSAPERAMPGRPVTADSVAVMPFVNLSAGENEYFADGMTEELINALARVEGLRVPGRTSVYALKDAGLTVSQIGERLGVSTILEGSVRIADDRMRVTAQLINVADEFQIWSETYDRTTEDIFAIQEGISRAIVENLRVRLVRHPSEPLVRPTTGNLEAYNLYLQGRHFWNRRTADALEKSIDLFARSAQSDPNFALAFAGLADAYVLLPERSDIPANEAFPRAKEAALKALELDDELAEAHTSLGQVMRLYDKNFDAAEKEFRRAITLDPGYATGHHWLGMNLFFEQERRDEGLEHLERAEQLDPLSGVIKFSLGGVLRAQGHLDRAIQKLTELRDLDPTYPVYNALSSAYFQKRLFPQSVEALRQKRERAGLGMDDWISLTGTLHLAGEHAAELKEARQARAENPGSWHALYMEARSAVAMGRTGDVWRLVREGADLPTSFSAGPQLLVLAEELRVHGHRKEAAEMARRAIDFYSTLGDLGIPVEPAYRFAVASALGLTGQANEARTLFDRAADDDRLGAQILPLEEYLGYSGSFAALAGDAAAARARAKKLVHAEEIDAGSRLFWQSAIAASLGESERAVALLREATSSGFWAWGRLHRLHFFEPLWHREDYRDLMKELGLPLTEFREKVTSPTAG